MTLQEKNNKRTKILRGNIIQTNRNKKKKPHNGRNKTSLEKIHRRNKNKQKMIKEKGEQEQKIKSQHSDDKRTW